MSDPIPSYTPTAPEPITFPEAVLKALVGPSSQNFQRLASSPGANATQGFLWTAIAAAIAALISGIISSIFPYTAFQPGALLELLQRSGMDVGDLPRFGVEQGPGFFGIITTLVCGIPLAIIFSLIGLAISAGIFHLIAMLLGGQGDYGKMVYMFALVSVPFTLINSLLSAIPYINCLLLPLGIYAIVLYVLAIDGVYRFGIAKAALTYFIPVIVLCLLAACLIGVGFAALGPAISEVFEEIQRGITP
jgi:hypothetical protein